jgi:hypothetical protein
MTDVQVLPRCNARCLEDYTPMRCKLAHGHQGPHVYGYAPYELPPEHDEPIAKDVWDGQKD